MKVFWSKLFIYASAFLGFMFGGVYAQAEGASAQFGIVYGSSVPDSDNTSPYWLSGVKGSAYVSPALSVGGYYLMSDTSGQPSSAEKFRYSLHGVEAAYHLPSGGGEVFFALRGGFSKVKTESAGNKIIYSPYHLGFATGYDYFVLPWFVLGFEGSLVRIKSSDTTDSGTNYKLDGFNVINFLVTFQFRI